jgi:hypothetical protein
LASFVLTALTRDPLLARRADEAGVDRIGVDVERHGKMARQGHVPDARISDHELGDLDRLAPELRRAALFARVNPPHRESRAEIEAALAHGARVLMLPFFHTAAEVEAFVRAVDGRATAVLLVETAAALVGLRDILSVAGIDEVMLGLNDLRVSLGLGGPFELIASDRVTAVAEQVRGRGLPFGFGGLARAGDTALPVPADLVIAQHARLGSSSAWLSRSFFGPRPESLDLGAEVRRLRERLAFWSAQPDGVLRGQGEELRAHLRRAAAV